MWLDQDTGSELPPLPPCGRIGRLSQEAYMGSLMAESIFLDQRASEVWPLLRPGIILVLVQL